MVSSCVRRSTSVTPAALRFTDEEAKSKLSDYKRGDPGFGHFRCSLPGGRMLH